MATDEVQHSHIRRGKWMWEGGMEGGREREEEVAARTDFDMGYSLLLTHKHLRRIARIAEKTASCSCMFRNDGPR